MNTTAPRVVQKHSSLYRLWEWSHGNGLTLAWITLCSLVICAVTVVTCR